MSAISFSEVLAEARRRREQTDELAALLTRQVTGRSVGRTRDAARTLARLDKARRYFDALVAAADADVDPRDLILDAAGRTAADWEAIAEQIGEKPPGQVTLGMLIGLYAGLMGESS